MKWSHWVSFLFALLALQRCARQTQPNGGPKDSIPPTLLTSTPANNQKNYHGKSVTLIFNEFIKLKDAKEIIITPTVGKNINIVVKNKNLTIEPKNPWKDSTTYSIAFREAIQDITESLPAQNLHLAFSTGSIIDSLTIAGTVHLALKESVPEKILVALYQPDTFNIFKHSPQYFTETEKDGSFKINNLKAGTYHLYAFNDKNKNLKVDSQSELYGFKSDTIHLTTNTTNQEVYLIRVDSRKLKVNNVRHNSRMTTVKLSKPVSSYHLTCALAQVPLNTYGDTQAELYIYHPTNLVDSTSVSLTATDSVDNKLDTVIYIKASDARFVAEKFKVSITAASVSTQTGEVDIELAISVPLKKIKPDTLQITLDSTSTFKINPSDIRIDTSSKKAQIKCTLAKITLENSETQPLLFFSKGVFVSIDNDSSVALRIPISYLKEAETGKLSVQIKTAAPHYLIQLVDKEYNIIQQYKDQNTVDFSFLKPADYKIRAILDTNNNGKWDIGSYDKRIEPEKIIYLKTGPKSFDTPLRANWEATAPPFSF